MATPANRFVPSLIDRLIGDDAPIANRFTADPAAPVRDAVVRDLVSLLNTRARCVGWREELSELDRTLFNYGLPDFAGRDFATEEDREYLRDSIGRVIETFEPRLADVIIYVDLDEESADRHVRLQIMARLVGADEPLVVDLNLEEPSGEFRAEES
ncbi:MAG: type VI secretion system baseplate subunit TssE [Planctomycetaceae bacterium]